MTPLLTLLDAGRMSVIPVTKRHLSIGDPTTQDGRLALSQDKECLAGGLTLNISNTASTLPLSYVCLAQMCVWMLSVDDTGDAFLPRTDGLFFENAQTSLGVWDSEMALEHYDGIQDEDTPLFLYKGRLYGDHIDVSLDEIYTMPVFQEHWYGTHKELTLEEMKDAKPEFFLLPAKPALVALFCAAFKDVETRDNVETSAFFNLFLSVFPNATRDEDILSYMTDWIQDKTFDHGDTRLANLGQDRVQLNDLLPLLPTTRQDLNVFCALDNEGLSGHEIMDREVTRTKAMALLSAY